VWCRCLERILRSGSSRRWLQNGWLRWSTAARCACAEGPLTNFRVLCYLRVSLTNFRVLCGVNLVTYHADFRVNEIRVARRVRRSLLCQVTGSVGRLWRAANARKVCLTPTTQWSTTHSSKVEMPHAFDLRVLCGANLVTYHANFRGGETRTALRVGRGLLCQAACTVDGCWRSYLTESVFKVVLQKSAPISVRQLILHIGNHKGKVDEFVQMCKHFL